MSAYNIENKTDDKHDNHSYLITNVNHIIILLIIIAMIRHIVIYCAFDTAHVKTFSKHVMLHTDTEPRQMYLIFPEDKDPHFLK